MPCLCSPIGWIILAIGALVAISVAMEKLGRRLQRNKRAWEWLKTTAVNIWNGIADFFVAYWPWILGVSQRIGLVIGYTFKTGTASAKTAEFGMP